MSRRQERHVKFDSARVAARRQELGLTNEQLAQLVGATLRTVQRWQDGSNAPSGLQLLRLAKVLEINPAELSLEEVPAA